MGFARKAALSLAVLAITGGAAGLWLTAPERIDPADLAGLSGDATRGEVIFNIGGCASCHAAPGAEEEARLVLAGGEKFVTEFGTFIAPNISPGPEGIAGWSAEDLANAMMKGVGREGEHLYPAFPYPSYERMKLADVIDLKAYLDTLPVSDMASQPHELGFPFNIRRGLGLWKLINLHPEPIFPSDDPLVDRGRYLVEGPGHCGECHTPRDVTGGTDMTRWLAGGPNPDGKGKIPSLRQGEGGLDWSAVDIAAYLKTGFTPDYDVAGSSMADVIRNTSKLPDEDHQAIAAYLKSLPPL